MKTTKCYLERCQFRWNCWNCGYSHSLYISHNGIHNHLGRKLADFKTLKKGYMIVKCDTGFDEWSAAGCGCGAKRKIKLDMRFGEQFLGSKVQKLAKILRRTNEEHAKALKARVPKKKVMKKETRSPLKRLKLLRKKQRRLL